MQHTFKTLAICLLASTTLFASPGAEEASQAPHGIKRLAEALTHEDADVPKKIKREVRSQEEANEEEMAQETSLALLDLPTEVLTCMAQNLSSNKDLLTLAATNKDLFAVALTVFYKRNSPTRIWTSGLSFSDDLEGEMLRFTFTAKIMPEIMKTMLVMYKGTTHDNNTGRHVFAFNKLLSENGSLTSSGQKLKRTPLWAFLSQIDNTLCSSMPLASFSLTNDAGDGDKVFANMLHYIKDNFQTSPDALTAYEAPKNERFSSPQMRLHKAFLLRKNQLPGAVNVIEQANLWDEIYKTFDHIFFYESHVTAATYGLAGDAETDPQKKAHFYAKSAQLYDSHHSALPELKAQGVYTVASAYHKAGFFALQQSEKEKYFSKAAQWYSRYLDKLAEPPLDALRATAYAHGNLARATLDPSRRIRALLACASYWDAFLEKAQTPTPDDMKTASSVYRTIADTATDPVQRTAYLNKCAALFQRHLAFAFPPRNPS